MSPPDQHPPFLPAGQESRESCLQGGGEMGALMRSIDWSRTRLGAVSQWPRSLKTMVGVVLGSRFPMLVWWGPEHLQLYNDAYRPVLGVKHPGSMGAPGKQIWPEIWDVIGPMCEGVLHGGPPPWHEDFQLFINSRGFVEETFHTFSYSPVPDDDGGVGGVLNTVQETTQKVQDARQLRLLRDLGARAAEAKSAEEACHLATSVLRENAADIPFALLYLLEADARSARLSSTSGLEGHPGLAALEAVSLQPDAPGAAWPLAEAMRVEHVRVEGLGTRLSPVPSHPPRGVPTGAIVVSLARPGQPPYGFLVAGLSPHRRFDERYLGLVRLTADQIVSAIANARAYEEERRRAEALAEIDRTKTAFFSNVSHEFRTPLTLLLGPTEDALASPQQVLTGENLNAVHRNALRLLKLVNALLDFSRIEAGRARAVYEPTDLASVTTDLASAFRSAIERAGLRFEVRCPPLPEQLYVDRDMWEKIVLNLLSNALKFTFEGEIGVALHWHGDRAELVVRDTGVGVPEKELPHLFERFHRVQGARSRTHEGSGIGLALVHELVRLHGGTVQVSSELDRGTEFRVSIPRGHAHLARERVDTEHRLVTTATGAAPYVQEALRWLPGNADATPMAAVEFSELTTPGLGLLSTNPHARILLADDNADMRDYVRRLLGERWSVEAVGDGVAALAAARRQRPDLVLTDVMMPNLDGFGLLRALRADEALKAVPVIMLSARAGDESRVEGLEAGADDYLSKPFSARELIARVATHLQLAELREAALREREKIYSLFQQAPVGIVVFRGPEHIFEIANPRYLQLADKEENILGRTLRECLPELAGSGVYEMYDRIFATGEPVTREEYEAPLKVGDTLEQAYFSFNAQPIRDALGAVDAIMVVVVNVTEQVRARRALEAATREREQLLVREQEARRDAEMANRAKDEFLAMLGHELRNPLAPITTALHLIRLRAGETAAKERKIIERQVEHLTRLVDDLLDVSRITRGKVELKKERIELAEITAKAIEMASPLLEQRRHHLTVSVPARGLVLDADPTRLSQVVMNLLTNAAKYTEPGGRIEVAATVEESTVVVKVRDNGIGIAPDVLPRVFDLFVQERQALDRSLGGLGLGLAIVRSLVTMHGGRVSVTSEGRGRGSEFVLRLPLIPSIQPPGAEVVGEAPARKASLPAGLKILVVDDNQDAADVLAEALGLLGHETRVAHDGPAALRMAQEFAPRVVLLDIGLPVMDGYDVARRLREQASSEALHLIAVTGYGQESDRARAKEAGFDAHLVKPVEFAHLQTLFADIQPGC